MPESLVHGIQAATYLYSVIRRANICEQPNNLYKINYYQELGPVDVVDLNQVKCVVGRIRDRGKWAIVDRSGTQIKAYVS